MALPKIAATVGKKAAKKAVQSGAEKVKKKAKLKAVSYTHLRLPTTPYV